MILAGLGLGGRRDGCMIHVTFSFQTANPSTGVSPTNGHAVIVQNSF